MLQRNRDRQFVTKNEKNREDSKNVKRDANYGSWVDTQRSSAVRVENDTTNQRKGSDYTPRLIRVKLQKIDPSEMSKDLSAKDQPPKTLTLHKNGEFSQLNSSYDVDGDRQSVDKDFRTDRPKLDSVSNDHSRKINFVQPRKEVDLGLMQPGQSRHIFQRDKRFHSHNEEPKQSIREQNKVSMETLNFDSKVD